MSNRLKTLQQALLLRDLRVSNESQGQITVYFPSLVGGPPVARTLSGKEVLTILSKDSEYTLAQARGSSNLVGLVEMGLLVVQAPKRNGARA